MWDVLKKTSSEFSEDKCTMIAAGLAYYTAFALAPMLMLILTIAQMAFEPEDLRGQLRSEVESVVGQAGAEQIELMLDTDREEEKQGIVASLIGGIVLLIGATGLFAQLQTAMNDVWEVKPDPELSTIKNFIMKRVVSLGMLLTLAFLVMVSITASSVIHAWDEPINQWLPGQSGSLLLLLVDYGITMAVLTMMFAGMFRYLPDAHVAWSDVWLGALVTAGLFLVGKFGIASYVGNASTASTFGAAGSLVVLLMWVYYSALIFLFGAEFTQSLASLHGNGIIPEDGAVRVVTTTETVDASDK